MIKIFMLSIIILTLIGCTQNNNKEKDVEKELILEKYNINEKYEDGKYIRLNYIDVIEEYKIYKLYENTTRTEAGVDICYDQYYYHSYSTDVGNMGSSSFGLYFIKEQQISTFEEIWQKDLISNKKELFNILKDFYGQKNNEGVYVECRYENGEWIKPYYR